jgi:hypothetical protein
MILNLAILNTIEILNVRGENESNAIWRIDGANNAAELMSYG